jgi:hypothetical protein
MGTIEKCLLVIFCVVMVLLASALGIPCFKIVKEESTCYSLISFILTVANVFLIYETLHSHKQERFEGTLFSLLENHRRLLASLNVLFCIKDCTMKASEKVITNVELFKFANSEYNLIKKILKEPKYPSISEDDVQDEMGTIACFKEQGKESIEYAVEREKALAYFFNLTQKCQLYGITKDEWLKSCKGEQQINEHAYVIFLKKWKHNYEPYFRSLVLMFEHIKNSSYSLEEKINYRRYILNQMSDDELFFVKQHYLYYADAFNDYTFNKSIDAISRNNRFVNKKV